MSPPTKGFDLKKAALIFILLLGVVSMFADMTYEGARSITGPYLQVLGASAAVVGFVAGLGEFIGYAFRLGSGYITDKTRQYWAITLLGYGINLLAVPALALAGNWPLAATLLMTERFGKAVRSPAKDVILSHPASHLGRGWGFGVHEALDQLGAITGPLIVAGVMLYSGSYRVGFAVLLVPAVLAICVLLVAKDRYPEPDIFEKKAYVAVSTKGFPRVYWAYLAGVTLVAAAFADFALISYHFQKTGVVGPDMIPVFYAVAMATDALSALGFGRIFDRAGIPALAVSTLISALFAPLVFMGGFWAAFIGMVMWGIGLGAQESIMRAAIAGLIPTSRRGMGYGVFNLFFGASWFLGSALMGLLYDYSIPYLVGFSLLLQLAAIPVFLGLRIPEQPGT